MIRLFQFLIPICILLMILSPVTSGQTEQSALKGTYDAYNLALKAGDFDKIVSFCASDIQKEILSQVKSKEDREQFLLSGKAQVPESYEILHMETGTDGLNAALNTVMLFDAMKEIERARGRVESEIHFKKENNIWKMVSVMFLTAPDNITHDSDLTYNPVDADLDKEGSVGGRIVSVDFKPVYTIVIIRILDEEDVVFLPKKDDLEKQGYSLKELVPWNIFEFNGHPHKTDKLKFFATSGNIISK